MLSVIIPCYQEPFLQKTVDSLLENAEGEIEIIVSTDEIEHTVKPDSRVRVITEGKHRGMRGNINAGLKEAKGEFVMKTDAHCAFGKGYDRILTETSQPNWLIIPRRYSLDEPTWNRDEGKYIHDYHYLSFPEMVIVDWHKSNDILIDDTMSFQGSCWLANKEYFMKQVGFLDDRPETYGSFIAEQIEIGLKYWLNGGEIKVNKHTWYAHLFKRQRHYDAKIFSTRNKRGEQIVYSNKWTSKHWMNNEEPGMKYPFSWLIKRFNPPGWETYGG